MTTDNKRVLVTGGSGFIGTNVIDFLINRNIELINFDINAPSNKEHKQYWKLIDIRDDIAFEREMKNFQPSHICHLAAATGVDIEDRSHFDANINGVMNLIKAAKRITSIERILFTSSLLVCRNGYIPKSDNDYCPPNLYGESKMLGEKIVKDCKDPNFTWSIIRPTSVWGPWCEDGYTMFFKTIDRNLYMHPGPDEIIKPMTYVGNTADMICKILFSEKETVHQGTFYLSDYPECSTRQWARLIQENLRVKKIKTAPLWLMKLIAITGDCFKLLGYPHPPLTSFRLNNMLTGGNYPINNTMTVCKDLPFTVKEGVALTLEWLYKKDEIRNKPQLKSKRH